MSDAEQLPGPSLRTLYARWSRGGAGLIISGNVMIDARAMTGAAGVVLDSAQPIAPFTEWAKAAHSGGGRAWLQINHPGRQTPAALGQEAVAPSAIPVRIPGHEGRFPTPHALREDEIFDLVDKFATTAQLVEKVGFSGVQIHAAHGYLISQFLSPLANQREDDWGGSLDRRSRFLIEMARAVRARVVELSGGTYESPAMQGRVASGDVLTRGGYFVELARTIAARAAIPIMVTGGITERAAAEAALTPGHGGAAVAMVGIASALGFYPDLPREWRDDMALAPQVPRAPWKSPVGNVANMEMVRVQLRRLGRGQQSGVCTSPLWALAAFGVRTGLTTLRYKRWLGRRTAALQDSASSREARGLLPG